MAVGAWSMDTTSTTTISASPTPTATYFSYSTTNGVVEAIQYTVLWTTLPPITIPPTPYTGPWITLTIDGSVGLFPPLSTTSSETSLSIPAGFSPDQDTYGPDGHGVVPSTTTSTTVKSSGSSSQTTGASLSGHKSTTSKSSQIAATTSDYPTPPMTMSSPGNPITADPVPDSIFSSSPTRPPEPQSPSATSNHFSPSALAGVIVTCAVLILAFGGTMLWKKSSRWSKPNEHIEAAIAKHEADGAGLSTSNRNSMVIDATLKGRTRATLKQIRNYFRLVSTPQFTPSFLRPRIHHKDKGKDKATSASARQDLIFPRQSIGLGGNKLPTPIPPGPRRYDKHRRRGKDPEVDDESWAGWKKGTQRKWDWIRKWWAGWVQWMRGWLRMGRQQRRGVGLS